MANIKKKRNENIDGDLFVDDTCIDCGTCYWMAPNIYSEINDKSAVTKQPEKEYLNDSLQALLSCPTSSIGYCGDKSLIVKAKNSLPRAVDDSGEVLHVGFHAESSFGAASYFIKSDQGNILVDGPKYLPHLVNRFKDFGGIAYQFLTHEDDVADTDRYQAVFSSERIMHKDDLGDRDYEIIITGADEYRLNEETVIIPVPGHTKGSIVLLYKGKYLFTGDHLAWSRHYDQLVGFRRACWYDYSVQISSMERLLDYEFTHILPGHGKPFLAKNSKAMRSELEKCIKWMKEML